MADTILKGSSLGYGNSYQEIREKLKSTNYLYDPKIWNEQLQTGTQDAYIGMATKLGSDLQTYENFKKTYNYDFLSDDYKILAMSNEMFSDREKTSTRTYINKEGKRVSEELSDYEWNKKILQENSDENLEEFRKQEWEKRLEDLNFFQTIGHYIQNVGAHVSVGLVEVFNGFMEAIGNFYDYFGQWAPEVLHTEYKKRISREIDKYGYTKDENGLFKGVLTVDELKSGKVDSDKLPPIMNVGKEAYAKNEVYDAVNLQKFYEWNYDWLKEHGIYDYYGNSTESAAFVAGMGESVGRMIPTALLSYFGGAAIGAAGKAAGASAASISAWQSGLSVTAQGLFYVGMFAQNMSEMVQDDTYAPLSTVEMVTRAGVQSLFEYAIEKLLGKGFEKVFGSAFGKTAIDNFAYGLSDATGAVITNKTVGKKVFVDMLQEGLEEVLQDFSGYFYDRMGALYYSAMNNELKASIFENATEFNLKTVALSFAAGAIMSLGGSVGGILLQDRVSTGIPKLDKNGEYIRDKKGNIKTVKLTKLESYTVSKAYEALWDTMGAITDMDNDLTVEERTALIKNVIITTNTLKGIFSDVNASEVEQVFKLLNNLEQSYDRDKVLGYIEKTDLENVSNEDVVKARKKLGEDIQLETLNFINNLNSNKYKNAATAEERLELQKKYSELKKSKQKESLKDRLKENLKKLKRRKTGKVIETITLDNVETSSLSEQGKNNATELLNSTESKNLIVTDSGTAPVEVEGIQIVPKAELENTVVDYLIRDRAFHDLVERIVDTELYANHLEELCKFYKERFPQLAENKTEDDLKLAVVSQLLTDGEFVFECFESFENSEILFDFVTMLQTYSQIEVKNEATKIENAALKKSFETVKSVVKNYIILADDIDYKNLPFLTEKELKYIEDKRYLKDKLISWENKESSPTEEEVNAFREKLNNSVVTLQDNIVLEDGTILTVKDYKARIVDYFKINPSKAVGFLKAALYYQYKSVYDDVYYWKKKDITSALGNSFLRNTRLTVKDLQEMSTADFKEINKAFREFTNNRFTISRTKNKVFVDERLESGEYRKYSLIQTGEALNSKTLGSVVNKTFYDITNDLKTGDGKKRLEELVNKTDSKDVDLKTLSVNDFIIGKNYWNPEVLSKENLQTVESRAVYLSALIYKYTKSRMGIIYSNTGQYVLTKYKNINTLYKDVSGTKNKDKWEGIYAFILNKAKTKTRFKLSDIYKTDLDIDVKFYTPKKGDKDYGLYGYFKHSSNTIYLNTKKLNEEAITEQTLLHEYYHAKQYDLDLEVGFSSSKFLNDYNAAKSSKDKYLIYDMVKDIKDHINESDFNYYAEQLLNSKDRKSIKDLSKEDILTVVGNIVYWNVAGELNAENLEIKTPDADTAVFHVIPTKQGLVIQAPWGSYNLSSYSKNIDENFYSARESGKHKASEVNAQVFYDNYIITENGRKLFNSLIKNRGDLSNINLQELITNEDLWNKEVKIGAVTYIPNTDLKRLQYLRNIIGNKYYSLVKSKDVYYIEEKTSKTKVSKSRTNKPLSKKVEITKKSQLPLHYYNTLGELVEVNAVNKIISKNVTKTQVDQAVFNILKELEDIYSSDKLKIELDKLNKEVSNLTELKQKYDKKYGNIAKIKSTIKKAESEIESDKSTLNKLTDTKTKAENVIKAYENNADSDSKIESIVNDLRNTVSEIEEKISALNKKIESNEKKLETYKNNSQKYLKIIKIIDDKKKDLSKAVSNYYNSSLNKFIIRLSEGKIKTVTQVIEYFAKEGLDLNKDPDLYKLINKYVFGDKLSIDNAKSLTNLIVKDDVKKGIYAKNSFMELYAVYAGLKRLYLDGGLTYASFRKILNENTGLGKNTTQKYRDLINKDSSAKEVYDEVRRYGHFNNSVREFNDVNNNLTLLSAMDLYDGSLGSIVKSVQKGLFFKHGNNDLSIDNESYNFANTLVSSDNIEDIFVRSEIFDKIFGRHLEENEITMWTEIVDETIKNNKNVIKKNFLKESEITTKNITEIIESVSIYLKNKYFTDGRTTIKDFYNSVFNGELGIPSINNDATSIVNDDTTNVSENETQMTKTRRDVKNYYSRGKSDFRYLLTQYPKVRKFLAERYPNIGIELGGVVRDGTLSYWDIPYKFDENGKIVKYSGKDYYTLLVNMKKATADGKAYLKNQFKSPKEVKAAKNELKRQIDKTQSELKSATKKSEILESKLESTKSDLKTTKSRNKELEAEIKKLKKSNTSLRNQLTEYKFNGDENTLVMYQTKPMPKVFKTILTTTFEKTDITQNKFGFVELNETHTVKQGHVWWEQNVSILNSNEFYENANDIVEYILTSEPYRTTNGSKEDIVYDSIAIFTLSYIYENRATLGIRPDLVIKIENMAGHESSKSATKLALLKNFDKDWSDTFNASAREYGIEFKEEDVAEMQRLVNNAVNNSDIESVNGIMTELTTLYNSMKQEAIEQYQGSKKDILDKILAFEKMCMLSGPGTWFRNIVSNITIKYANKVSGTIGDKIWGALNKIADRIAPVVKKSLKAPQYDSSIDEGVKTATSLVGSVYYRDLTDNEELAKGLDELRKADRTIIKFRSWDTKSQQAFIQLTEGELTELKVLKKKFERKRGDNSAKLNELNTSIQEKELLLSHLNNPKGAISSFAQAISATRKLMEYNVKKKEYDKKINGVPIRKSLQGQWKIVGTKVDAKTADFVQKWVFDTGFYNLVKEGLTSNKYSTVKISMASPDNVAFMIKQSMFGEIFKASAMDLKILNQMNDIIFNTLLSDSKFVDDAFRDYLSKMLVESKLDLSHGLTNEILTLIKDAYVRASWDYMHGSNIFNSIEYKLRQYSKKAYFMWKQVSPFAAAGVNWFTESLKFTPLGLVKGLIQFANLEQEVNTAKMRSDTGGGPSEAFVVYDIKKTLGKGLIGTANFMLLTLLSVLGVVSADEDDNGNTVIRISNLTINLKEITGALGLTLGAIVGTAIRERDVNFFEVLAEVFDNAYDDSFFGDLGDMFRYYDGVSGWFLDRVENVIGMFVPNLFKSVAKVIFPYKSKYNDGLKGKFEKLLVTSIPGIAYAFPKQYDPYTGELQMKYGSGFWGWFFNILNVALPGKIGVRTHSKAEEEAVDLGIHKGSLTGRYEDIGTFSAKDNAVLNTTYGSMNKVTLNTLMSNKKRYKVIAYDRDGNKLNYYQQLTYSQMNDQQKKSVIDRLMTNNAKYAKIYTWTSMGHKYYATESEYIELRKLGVFNANLRREQGRNKGFKD